MNDREVFGFVPGKDSIHRCFISGCDLVEGLPLTDLMDDFLGGGPDDFAADNCGGGVTPLIGMIRDRPTFRTGVFPKLFACTSCDADVPYFFAIRPSVSPFRTTCSRNRTRLLSGMDETCWLNFS